MPLWLSTQLSAIQHAYKAAGDKNLQIVQANQEAGPGAVYCSVQRRCTIPPVHFSLNPRTTPRHVTLTVKRTRCRAHKCTTSRHMKSMRATLTVPIQQPAFVAAEPVGPQNTRLSVSHAWQDVIIKICFVHGLCCLPRLSSLTLPHS